VLRDQPYFHHAKQASSIDEPKFNISQTNDNFKGAGLNQFLAIYDNFKHNQSCEEVGVSRSPQMDKENSNYNSKLAQPTQL
jgi:hypothetical protein